MRSSFLENWIFACVILGSILAVLALLSAPLLFPLLLGDTWWAFTLAGVAYFIVISFLVALMETAE